jgi:hypothetical protein
MAMIAAPLVLLGSSAATAETVHWTPAHELAPQEYMSTLTWGDLDADGDDDVACTSNCLWWNEGGCPGPALWRREAHVLPGTSEPCTSRRDALGDLDADGDLDLVAGCFQEMMYMYWNVGTPDAPSWEYDPSVFSGGAYFSVPFLADLDGDSDLDIILVTGCGAAFFWRNTGTQQVAIWDTSVQVITPILLGAPAAIAAGDLDGDGDLDIVGITDDTPLQCWENVGTPQVWQVVENSAMLTGVEEPGQGGLGIALPDVDCDGDPDLLFSSNGAGYLYLNDSISAVTPVTWGAIRALYK